MGLRCWCSLSHMQVQISKQSSSLNAFFPKGIWNNNMCWYLVKYPKSRWVCWDDIIGWGQAQLKGEKSLMSIICRIALRSAVYHIWQQRNAVIHQRRISFEEGIERMIRWEVKSRVKTRWIIVILFVCWIEQFAVFGEFLFSVLRKLFPSVAR